MKSLVPAFSGVAASGLVLAIACSSGGGRQGGSSSGGSNSGGGNMEGGASVTEDGGSAVDSSSDVDTSHVYPVCVTTLDGQKMRCGGIVGQGSPFASTCLGSNQFCQTAPFSATFKIDSGFAVPLTASLWICTGASEASCVPATNESPGTPLAVQLTFGAPNGNVGPHTTLMLQQVGTSVGASCPNTTVAVATHFKVEDSYGNYVYISFNQSACCPPYPGCQ